MVRPVPNTIEQSTFDRYAAPIAATRHRRADAQRTAAAVATRMAQRSMKIVDGRYSAKRRPTWMDRGGSMAVGVLNVEPLTVYSSTSFDRVARL
jgi:hypothetical protein